MAVQCDSVFKSNGLDKVDEEDLTASRIHLLKEFGIAAEC